MGSTQYKCASGTLQLRDRMRPVDGKLLRGNIRSKGLLARLS